MPNAAKPEHYTYLRHVTTVAGAARLYYVDRKTILYNIDAGNLAAFKEGGTWLVSIPSLIEWYGYPPPE
ncbi:MAG: hypothetical protein AAF125_28445 [Chloroflexota bacterium]